MSAHAYVHVFCCLCFFFFSSRRRHTRFDCDWSSDVCSSDLSELRSTRTRRRSPMPPGVWPDRTTRRPPACRSLEGPRSEEHTSELQSQSNLVCRLLLEKKKNKHTGRTHPCHRTRVAGVSANS